MNGQIWVYAGAAVLFVFVLVTFFVDRPVEPVWRDPAALIAGFLAGALVAALSLAQGWGATAWPAALLWLSAVAQLTHVLRERRRARV
ncbi:hypothetical protein QNO07_27470 [Streptomyces sp. 549]|uniref:hypothetical protein n=1 Tax=Streptomyces sp. 549 TaxID=3049076 RepID=UPI0024C26EBD|nr:hypothetical protein [Streptomyces sp. 549]MDK1477087.1 hypothetical protein [Streptomyces sp. 549]